MFENLSTLPLSSHVFAQAIHPTDPVFTVGLAGGHVESFRLTATNVTESNSSTADEMNMNLASTGTSTIDSQWRTRRHRGSCRSLTYSEDGEALYSCGTDGIIKAASSNTGRVFAKYAIPLKSDQITIDEPCLLHVLSPQTLILATDSAALHVYDFRQHNSIVSKPAQTHQPHDDYVTSLTSLPPTTASTSGFIKQWVSTGGSTLAVTDLRKGVICRSEDQEEDLMCSIFVKGLPFKPGKSKGEKLIVGDSRGFLTLWERGFWEDQQERIKVVDRKSNSCAVESLALAPDEMGEGGKNIIVGMDDGNIRIVKLGSNKVISTLQHDEVDGVVALGFDVERRLISGGGMNVKVWQESLVSDISDSESNEEQKDHAYDSNNSSDDEVCQHNLVPSITKDDSEDDEIGSRLKLEKKRKRSRVCQEMNAHGILRVRGID